MTCSTSIADISYIAAKGILLAINQPTGRWCSVNLADIDGPEIIDGYGRIESLLTQDGKRTSLVDAITAELLTHENRAQSDTRSFEFLLLKCTSACNYSCTYCYDHDEIHKSKNLDFDKTCERVKEAIDLAKGHLTVGFHGGEPLLQKRFVQDVAAFAKNYADASSKKIFFKLQTHGGAFTDEIVDFLSAYDFSVGISLDGPPEINDKFRVLKNGRGTYEKFYAAYVKYGAFMRERCGIITTPTNVSAQHLLFVARHFRDMGFKAWRTTDLLAVGRLQDDWQLETDTETYVSSILDLVGAIEAGEFEGFRIGPVMTFLNNLLTNERPDMCAPGNSACGAGKRFLSIEADGVILPCDALSREEFSVGSIDVDSLKAALSHPNSRIIAESLPRNDCKKCSLLGVCGGTCLALSSLTSNRPMLCNSYKRLYPELMRRLHSSTRLLEYFDECNRIEDARLNLLELEEIS